MAKLWTIPLLAPLGLLGCESQQQKPNPWSTYYMAMGDQPSKPTKAEVSLADKPLEPIPGYHQIGKSSFTLSGHMFTPDELVSALRKHASQVGADRAQWSQEFVKSENRNVPTPVYGPRSIVLPTGNAFVDGMNAGSANSPTGFTSTAITVDVYGYRAGYFVRDAPPK